CPKKFNRKSSLSRHFRKHTGKKPFSFNCTLCPKKFGRKSSLSRHFRKHTGERYFSCEACCKSFSRRDIEAA
ncbi:hypothetical protein CONCODRAFT_45001, partial [Conidiobolus coronatus NRRL 28638]